MRRKKTIKMNFTKYFFAKNTLKKPIYNLYKIL